jgi:hypothetical protein
MCFLIATLALVIALFAGALVAPPTGKYPALRIDPCALETGGWSLTDPACSKMQIKMASEQLHWALSLRGLYDRSYEPDPDNAAASDKRAG